MFTINSTLLHYRSLHFFINLVRVIAFFFNMDPKLPNEELLQIILYDYLKKRNLSNTAEAFRTETQLNGQIPNAMDHPPHGFLYNIWSSWLYDRHRQRVAQAALTQPMAQAALTQPMAMNHAGAINTVPRILLEKYSIRLHERFGSDQTLLSCDISSDGNIVASGGNGMKPFLCYLETPDAPYAVTSVDSHSSGILDVRFQPGTSIFATASADTTVKLWDADKPQTALSDFGHNWRVRSLDFHPLGQFLCSSDAVDVIKVWDVNQQVFIESHEVGGSKVRFQPGTGKILAVANLNVIAIVDSSNFEVIDRLKGHVNNIDSICWDVTGRMIASVSEESVRVWSLVKYGQCIYNYPLKGRFHSVIFHPRYNDVLVIGGSECLEVFVLGNVKIDIPCGRNLSITGLAVAATTAQSEYIASVSNQPNSVVYIWK